MAFGELAGESILLIKDMMGVAIQYNGSEIIALEVLYGSGVSGTVHADTAEIYVAVEDVPIPAYRDTVEIADVSWRVHRDEAKGLAIAGDGYTWKIPLIRDERARSQRR